MSSNISPHSSTFPRGSAEFAMYATKEALQANGEFTPAMEEVFNDSFAYRLTGSPSPGLKKYEIETKYPDECQRISDVYMGIVFPGFLERTRDSFIKSRPFYQRIIIETGDFLTRLSLVKTTRGFLARPPVVKVIACAAAIAALVFFCKRSPTHQQH